MTYILIGGVILAVLWALSNAPRKAAKEEAAAKQLETVTSDRIVALMDELRRNPPPGSKIAEMSEAELKDFVSTHVREYNQKGKFAIALGGIGIALCLIGGFVFLFAGGPVPDWVFLLLLAGVVLFALAYWITKITDRQYSVLGLNPERLRIDDP